MKITLTPTGTIDTVEGIGQARIWEGTTEGGVPVKAWIITIQPQTHDPEATAIFERELKEVPLSRHLTSFDLRMA